MENNYKDIMSSKHDKQLIEIVYVRYNDYQADAVASAIDELNSRNIAPEYTEHLKQEILKAQQRASTKAELSLHTYRKVLTFIFPGILNWVFAILFSIEGYDKRTKEMWKWTFRGFLFYLLLIFILKMIFR